jgi:hypothetical protein
LDWKIKFAECINSAGVLLRRVSHEKKQEIFKYRAKQVHSGKYIYDTTVYGTSIQKVNIVCPIHGKFTQVARDHLSGCGCSSCSNIEFKYLYLFDLGYYYKIGITGRGVGVRAKEVARDLQVSVKILEIIESPNCVGLERELLSKYNKRTDLEGVCSTETRELTEKEVEDIRVFMRSKNNKVIDNLVSV